MTVSMEAPRRGQTGF